MFEGELCANSGRPKIFHKDVHRIFSLAYGYSRFDSNMSQKNDLKNGQGNLQAPLHGYVAVIASVFIFNVFLAADVIAAPEEIQVYLDDFTEVVKNPGNPPETDGIKLRARWRPRAPSGDSPFYWAVNFETGQLSQRFYPDETSGEIKLIGVWKTGPWTAGMNFNLDRSLKTHPMQAATSEIDTKIAYQVREGLQLGIENYSSLGAIHYDPTQPQSSQSNYLAADFNLGNWDFNAGIGHTSGQSPDKTVLKAIIGVPF
jgi:hypothetical protein